MISTHLEHAMWDLLQAAYTVEASDQGSGDTYYQVFNSGANVVAAGYDQENVLLDAHIYLKKQQEEES